MPKKITRLTEQVETNGDASNSFVAFVGGKPQLVKYQEGFVGDDDEDLDMPLVDRIIAMDGEQLRDLTEAEEIAIMQDPNLSAGEKIKIIQDHEDKISRQMDRVIEMRSYTRGVDEDE